MSAELVAAATVLMAMARSSRHSGLEAKKPGDRPTHKQLIVERVPEYKHPSYQGQADKGKSIIISGIGGVANGPIASSSARKRPRHQAASVENPQNDEEELLPRGENKKKRKVKGDNDRKRIPVCQRKGRGVSRLTQSICQQIKSGAIPLNRSRIAQAFTGAVVAKRQSSKRNAIRRWSHSLSSKDTAIAVLRTWMILHLDDPYPNSDQQAELSDSAGLTIDEVLYWFINARVRLWRPLSRMIYFLFF
jgi:hypothetical protein